MKKRTKADTAPLPLTPQAGVTPLSIKEIDRAVDAYEREKRKREEITPDEKEAKETLQHALWANRDALPVNEDGFRFYRRDEVDYILTEGLKRRKVEADGPLIID